MSVEQGVVAACVAVVGVLAVLVALLWRRLAEVRREVAELRAGLDAPVRPGDVAAASSVEARRGQDHAGPGRSPVPGDQAFVITGAGAEPDLVPDVATRIEGRLFADIVARETVVKTAGLLHGLRRAASPQVRNRVRFEVRQELKRTRRHRRAEVKEALRDLRRRQREAHDPTYAEVDAGPTRTRTDDGTAA